MADLEDSRDSSSLDESDSDGWSENEEGCCCLMAAATAPGAAYEDECCCCARECCFEAECAVEAFCDDDSCDALDALCDIIPEEEEAAATDSGADDEPDELADDAPAIVVRKVGPGVGVCACVCGEGGAFVRARRGKADIRTRKG